MGIVRERNGTKKQLFRSSYKAAAVLLIRWSVDAYYRRGGVDHEHLKETTKTMGEGGGVAVVSFAYRARKVDYIQ